METTKMLKFMSLHFLFYKDSRIQGFKYPKHLLLRNKNKNKKQ